jgi:hypothetical protein
MEATRVKSTMCQSGDVPLLTNIFSVYVVGRNVEETDETEGK